MNRGSVPSVDERVEFAALESTLSLHQAAETLLRLYFAHENDESCPWVEMTKLRQPGALVRRVKSLRDAIDTNGTIAQIMRVVSFSSRRVDATPAIDAIRWRRHRDGLRELFRLACDLVVDGAALYNAGKHGLAILPSVKSVTLGDGSIVSASGPALTVIETRELNGESRWAKTTHWVNYERGVMSTTYIALAIRSLWACGKQRRLQDADISDVAIFDSELVARAVDLGKSVGYHTDSVSWSLHDTDHPMYISTDSEGDGVSARSESENQKGE